MGNDTKETKRRKKSVSPTQRTLKMLREYGITCTVAERFVPTKTGGFRQDLFGIIDVIALTPHGVLGIQVCMMTHFADHIKKITIDKADNTRDWLKTPGALLEVWAWRKLKVERGKAATYWDVHKQKITLEGL